eukprot:CAMPEP_0119021372 /NCGR_PEP_ID=MMETSP1176-20130426/25861_1 /TAXON_ID=265551 /ORGANISM="Synedropsis recta cf, Strain CCMP1620" /LENGTH=158 /DNA_ID=CAMNT_0006975957 /DNA_START=1 /DNA_END=477 /DNA_ORIENTATION=+
MGMFLVPLHIMSSVDWCFCGGPHKTLKSFNAAVQARPENNNKKGRWTPREVILPCIQKVGIQCGDRYVVLKTSNPDGFTAVSLLRKFHNAVCQRLPSESQHLDFYCFVRTSSNDPSHGMVKFRAMLGTGEDDDDEDIGDDDCDDDIDDVDIDNEYFME